MFPANGSLLMAPPFPRSGPGESSSPTSQVVLRCYDFPSRILGHLFVSLPRPTLPSSFVSRGLRSRAQKVRGCLRGRVVVQPATQLPVCSRVDVSGISQVPRRSVPCLCLVPGPRPNRRCLASLRSRRCCPRSLHSEDFSVMEISGLPRGFSTCCLRFTSGVATTHARLASGGRARLYRKGVEPSNYGATRKRPIWTESDPKLPLVQAAGCKGFSHNQPRRPAASRHDWPCSRFIDRNFSDEAARPWLGCHGFLKLALRARLFCGRQHPPWRAPNRRPGSPDWGTAPETPGRFRATNGS